MRFVSPRRLEGCRLVTGICVTFGAAKLGIGVGVGGTVLTTSGLVRAKTEISAMKPAKRRTDFIMRDVLECQVGHVGCWRWEVGFRRGTGATGVRERGRTWRKGSPARRRGRPAPEKDCNRASATAGGMLSVPPPTRHPAGARSVPKDPRRPSAQLIWTASPDPRIPGCPSRPALFATS